MSPGPSWSSPASAGPPPERGPGWCPGTAARRSPRTWPSSRRSPIASSRWSWKMVGKDVKVPKINDLKMAVMLFMWFIYNTLICFFLFFNNGLMLDWIVVSMLGHSAWVLGHRHSIFGHHMLLEGHVQDMSLNTFSWFSWQRTGNWKVGCGSQHRCQVFKFPQVQV